MPITTLNGVVATVPLAYFSKVVTQNAPNGILHSLAYHGPLPAAAGVPGGAVALTSWAGALPWQNPVAGDAYLAHLSVSASKPGQLVLYDRLWHTQLSIASGTQTINSASWPRNANGDGVMVAIEYTTANSFSTSYQLTMSYTNESGTSGRMATCQLPGFGFDSADEIMGSTSSFALQGGDRGVRSVQSLTVPSTQTSAVWHLVAYREIATVTVSRRRRAAFNPVLDGFPKLAANTVPCLMWLPSGLMGYGVSYGSPYVVQGRVGFVHG